MDDGRIKRVWDQTKIPVVLRRDGPREKLRVRLPHAPRNFDWLKAGRHTDPFFSIAHDCWEVPKAWFSDLVDRSLERYGQVYIVQPYREQEKCSPACLNATGHECQCSCMGANHGHGNDGSWFEVTDTFAFRWNERHLACRLLTAR